jgi:hypothetical protein
LAVSHALPKAGFREAVCLATLIKSLILFDFIGEPGGIRTHDPMIKSHVLYRLSYGLTSHQWPTQTRQVYISPFKKFLQARGEVAPIA